MNGKHEVPDINSPDVSRFLNPAKWLMLGNDKLGMLWIGHHDDRPLVIAITFIHEGKQTMVNSKDPVPVRPKEKLVITHDKDRNEGSVYILFSFQSPSSSSKYPDRCGEYI